MAKKIAGVQCFIAGGIAVGCPLSAVQGRYEKDYRVMKTDGMRMNWIQWHIDHPMYKLGPYAEGLLSPQASWLDWRNANHDGAGNDVPIEWGNNIDGFQARFYDNVDEKRIPGAFGRKTREVVMGIEDNFCAFPFCQYVYGKPGVHNATDAIPTAHCNDASHWSERVIHAFPFVKYDVYNTGEVKHEPNVHPNEVCAGSNGLNRSFGKLSIQQAYAAGSFAFANRKGTHHSVAFSLVGSYHLFKHSY